jgi:hypothetical protein
MERKHSYSSASTQHRTCWQVGKSKNFSTHNNTFL